jgi:hypothetical protein
MTRLEQLFGEFGQSPWLDNRSRTCWASSAPGPASSRSASEMDWVGWALFGLLAQRPSASTRNVGS